MQYWSLTDPGLVRTQNQDVFRIRELDKETLLAVVCDGMGGAKAGNVASSLASDVFCQELAAEWKPRLNLEERGILLRRSIRLVNQTVYEQSVLLEDFAGMGTTLVAALIHKGHITVVNVGDSRAYYINSDGIRPITTDHSMAQLMIFRGELTPEQALRYPGKNLITRAIGTEKIVQCDIFDLDADAGGCLLLCTDGLSNLVDEQEILFEIAHGGQVDTCCRRLLDIAKDRGAPDNITCVLVQL